MTRLMVMTFWGSERFRGGEKHSSPHANDATHGSHHEPHESPWVMTVPLIVLAVLSTLGGFLGVPYALGSFFSDHPVNYIERTLDPIVQQVPAVSHPDVSHAEASNEPVQKAEEVPPLHPAPTSEAASKHAHSPEEVRQERMLAGLSVLIAAGGIAIGWFVFRKRPLMQMPRLLENKYYVDEIYKATVIRPIEVGSRQGLWKVFDIAVIDGLLHSLGESVTEAGRVVRYLQSGFVRAYAAIILFGALAMIGVFAFLGWVG
jgi:NADH-quinone oxidoreductase subunit L